MPKEAAWFPTSSGRLVPMDRFGRTALASSGLRLPGAMVPPPQEASAVGSDGDGVCLLLITYRCLIAPFYPSSHRCWCAQGYSKADSVEELLIELRPTQRATPKEQNFDVQVFQTYVPHPRCKLTTSCRLLQSPLAGTR